MYKVFYSEKVLILSERPLSEMKSLKYSNEGQFEEALAILRNTEIHEFNIYYHNLNKLWGRFKAYFDYLEAAGGVVKNKEDKILFIYRLNKWDLPKGKVEKGETTEIAAVREVEEECGIRHLIRKELITTTYHIYFQGNLKLKATYWYRMNYGGEENLIPQNEEGITLAEWKNRDEIPKVLTNTYENIRLVMDQYYAGT